jgi:hypothetical protein
MQLVLVKRLNHRRLMLLQIQEGAGNHDLWKGARLV